MGAKGKAVRAWFRLNVAKNDKTTNPCIAIAATKQNRCSGCIATRLSTTSDLSHIDVRHTVNRF